MGAKSQQGAPATTNTNTGGVTASTVNTGPWQPQQPYLTDAFNKASSLYDYNDAGAGSQYYPTSTVSPFNTNQNDAFGSILRVNNNNVPEAQRENVATLQGRYLDPSSNPWLKSTFDQAGDAVTRQYMTGTAPQTAGAMAGAGRYNSGAYGNLLKGNEITYGKTLNDLATDIYGGNYSRERQNMMTAVGQAPGLAAAGYIDPLAHLAVGNQQQGQSQAEMSDIVNRYNFNRDAPTRSLNTYLGQIQGNYGQSGVSTGQTSSNTAGMQQSPYFTNPAASGAGGLLGLGSLFTGGSNSAASGIGSLFGKGGSGIVDAAKLAYGAS